VALYDNVQNGRLFIMPGMAGITVSFIHAQLLLWPLALLLLVLGQRRIGQLAAVSASLLGGLDLALSNGQVPYIGVTLLGVAIGLAVLASWRTPSPWAGKPWAWFLLAACLGAWFRMSPTHFVGRGDLSIVNLQQYYLHLGPLRILDGVGSTEATTLGTNVLVLDLYGIWLAAAIAAIGWRRSRPEVALGVAAFTPPFAFLNLHLYQRLFESAPTAVTWAGMGIAAAAFLLLAGLGLQIGRDDWRWLGCRLAGRGRSFRGWGY